MTTLIAVIGTLASVIGVIQAFTRDTTNFSHLTVAAEPAPGTQSDWAVPVDILHRFPADNNGACSTKQLEWLGANAQQIHRRYLLTLSNSAKEGSMLALTDFRSNALVASDRGELNVLLVCDPSGIVPDKVYYGRVDADKLETTARHVQLEYGRAPYSSPEIPITWNLAPGESGQFIIELFSKFPSTGNLAMSVLHREERREVELDGTEFSLPSLLFAGDMYLITGEDGLLCRRAKAGSLMDCTLAEMQIEIDKAQQ